jgi:sRNA-binding protein
MPRLGCPRSQQCGTILGTQLVRYAFPNLAKIAASSRLGQARTQIEVLKEKWPAIFNDPKNVRPFARSVLLEVAAALGWSNGYTRGVFKVWKGRNAYCRAVLCYSVRINLDGSPSEEVVDDRDRALAKAQLDQNSVRYAARRARELDAANSAHEPPQTQPTSPTS